MDELRKCVYAGKMNNNVPTDMLFHRWIEEGNVGANDGLDTGAILESESGHIIRVWDIECIQFTDHL